MPEGEEGRGCGRGRYRGGSCCLGSRIGEEVPLRVPRFCDECFLFFLYNEEVERERRGGNDDLLCVCVCVRFTTIQGRYGRHSRLTLCPA